MRTALDKAILCRQQKRKEATQSTNNPESESPGMKDPHDLQREIGPPAKKMTLAALSQPGQLPFVSTLGEAAISGESSAGGKKTSKEDKGVKTQLAENEEMENGGKKRKKEKVEDYISKRFRPSFSLKSLSFHRVLGEGSYGKVLLASDLRNNKPLAVKVVKKRAMLGSLRESIFVERRVLEITTGCAFLTHAYGTFQTKDHLFFVMEYLSGGDLFSYLQQNGRLDLRTVTFFAAEIVCGLQYLHSRGVIHRDLKPENILLDSTGHLKIADFGLALEGIFDKRKASGYAGTLGYIAPEMLKGKTYNAAVDWWAFGVILYEMATGEDPFYCGDTSEKVARSALQDIPYYPEYLSADTKHLLVKLLCKKPSRRLGATGNIREHPFFQSIDWKELEAGTLDPPISPSTPSMDGFLLLTEGKAISSSEAKKTPIGMEEQMLFNGFSFTSPKWNI